MFTACSTSGCFACPGPLAEALPWVLSTWLLVSTPPTGLDECSFFNSLVVRLPYSSMFCQFWLIFVFKFVVVLLLVIRGGTVCLPTPPSWLEFVPKDSLNVTWVGRRLTIDYLEAFWVYGFYGSCSTITSNSLKVSGIFQCDTVDRYLRQPFHFVGEWASSVSFIKLFYSHNHWFIRVLFCELHTRDGQFYMSSWLVHHPSYSIKD